ncbi:MAG TPA: TetR/AcrR family transcriptional regulator [Clostridia bacterium]|nr:TetR/AcrR family transcriptional regulator [Clostridia bacterium]
MRITKKPEERKQEIVEAALELFLQKGYDNVTVKDITTKVNVAAGLFHYYFHSKEDVLLECVRLDRKNFFDALTRSNCFPAELMAQAKHRDFSGLSGIFTGKNAFLIALNNKFRHFIRNCAENLVFNLIYQHGRINTPTVFKQLRARRDIMQNLA